MVYVNTGIRIRCPKCSNYGTLVIKTKGRYRQAYVIHWPDKQHYVSKFLLLEMGIDIDKIPITADKTGKSPFKSVIPPTNEETLK